MQSLTKVLKKNGVSYAKAFDLLCKTRSKWLPQLEYLQGIEGMQLGLSQEDLLAVLFK